jgi:hypothetical protein
MYDTENVAKEKGQSRPPCKSKAKHHVRWNDSSNSTSLSYHYCSQITPVSLVLLQNLLLGLSKSNGVVSEIVDRVPLSEESITKNGQRTSWLWEVDSYRTLDLLV